jgi:hypothetical protein
MCQGIQRRKRRGIHDARPTQPESEADTVIYSSRQMEDSFSSHCKSEAPAPTPSAQQRTLTCSRCHVP